MADGTLIFNTKIDTSGVDVGTEKIKVKLQKTTNAIKQQSSAVEQLEAKLKEWQAVAASEQADLGHVIPETQANVNAAASELDTAKIKLKELQVTATDTEAKLNAAMDPARPAIFATATDSARRRLEKFKSMLNRVIIRAAILVAVSQAISKIKDYFAEAFGKSDEYVQAVGQLKAALATLAQPIVQGLLPALVTVMRVLANIITLITKLFAGNQYSTYRNNAKGLNAESKAIKEVGSAAKKSGKQLADFDTVNKLSSSPTDSSGAGADSSSGIPADFDTNSITSKIDEITTYVAGAFLAIGAILLFTGANIPLGLGLLAIGALTLAAEIKENWGAMPTELQKTITNTMLVVAGALLVIGAIMVFSGADIPVGLALMAVGAASLAGAAVVNWNSMSPQMQNAISVIMAIVSTAFLALGAILTFSGANIPIGIALMVMGAAGLAGVAALNWDYIKNNITTVLGGILTAVGAFLAVIGLTLICTGVNIPLGVGLLISGAAAFGIGSAILQWDSMGKSINERLGKILEIAGACLLAVGLILTLTGVAAPLGIAMMVAGGAALGVAAIALNWDFLKDHFDTMWTNIQKWWDEKVAPKLTLEFWREKFSNIAEGLRQKIKDGVNAGIGLFNQFIDWVNDKLNITWDEVKIAGKTIIPAGNFQLFTIPHIPELATGAVIPPNKEFMAVLGDQKNGTNVEAPLSTIEQAVRNVIGAGGGNRPIYLYMDRRELGRAVVDVYNQENSRVGLKLT